MKHSLPSFSTMLPLCAALALSACTLGPTRPAPASAPPAPPPVAAAPEPEPDPLAPLLDYHQTLRHMTQGELLKELSSLYLQPKNAGVTVQIAMVLMLTHGSGDLSRAQTLLDNVANSADDDAQPLKPLAQLLSGDCSETRRYADHADRLAVQLREAQRRTDQLNDMVEGLKAIERAQPASTTTTLAK